MSVYSGKNKIIFCKRLGNDWQELADYLEISPYHRRQFQQGCESQDIWEWLEEKERLQELPEALKYIKREDLSPLFDKEKISPQALTRQQDWNSDEDFNQFQLKAFPKFLFFLPDRKPQKDELKKAIKDYRAQYSDKKQRPLLCLMHGDENEYGNFIKCLLKNFLPSDNGLSEHFRNGLFEIELLFEEFHTVDKLHQEILGILENKINANEKETIANKFAMERRPIIVHARLLTKDLEDWQDDQKTVLDGFIDFWADWPKKVYAQHQLFLVFLSVSYEGGGNNSSFFKKIFRGKKSRKASNSILLNQFENLNKTFPTIIDFFEGKKVHAKVLPKLDSVKRISACNWIKIYEDQINKFCDNTDAVERLVKALYENRNAIPMEELARELKTIVTTY